MRIAKTAEEAYDSCLTQGHVRDADEIDIGKAKSISENARSSQSAAGMIAKALNRQAKEWVAVFSLNYDALNMYAHALLIFDKVSISDQQCLFSYLCVRHPELELDWDFFEGVRTRKESIEGNGSCVTYDDWKSVELRMAVYLSALSKEVEKRTKEESG